ncbi:MAG: biotin synthase BioB [candidate division FCPU426 bacterium]
MTISAAVPIGLHPKVQAAYDVLSGRLLDRDLALSLGCLEGADILDLASLAHKVRLAFAPQTRLCTILNAKSGACSEDCKFCAQSGHHSAGIEVYPLLSESRILEAAGQAYDQGVRTFGLVTSGRGWDRLSPETETVLAMVRALRGRFPDLEICGSFGMLGEDVAAALAAAGVRRYNLNLQVAPGRYADLVSSTHAVSERLDTIRLLKRHGIQTCVGGIIGLGETMAERIELALALRDLDVDVVPLNVLLPLPGTALERQPPVPIADVVKTFALFRLLLPGKVIKFAAGRETKLKDFQGLLMLSGASGFLTGGYLTTRGRDIAEDQALARELAAFDKTGNRN